MKHLKICIFLTILITSTSYAQNNTNYVSNEMLLNKIELYQDINNKKFEMLVQEITRLREDMNIRFEQVDIRFEQVDKRFEQVDKRFEQVNKRFEFLQQIILALIAITTGTPIAIEYLRRKKDKRISEYQDEFKKIKHELQKCTIVISEFAKSDENMRSAIRFAEDKLYSNDAMRGYACT